jgi:transposase
LDKCFLAMRLQLLGGVPGEILYDRMKTAVIGEDPDGLVVYKRALLDLARHYGFQPRACKQASRSRKVHLAVGDAGRRLDLGWADG